MRNGNNLLRIQQKQRFFFIEIMNNLKIINSDFHALQTSYIRYHLQLTYNININSIAQCDKIH